MENQVRRAQRRELAHMEEGMEEVVSQNCKKTKESNPKMNQKAGTLLKRVEDEENNNNEKWLQLSIVHDDTRLAPPHHLTPPFGRGEAVEE
eukprot:scaffold3239_cov61-Cylindrotheca_fusiformis.AAC.1